MLQETAHAHHAHPDQQAGQLQDSFFQLAASFMAASAPAKELQPGLPRHTVHAPTALAASTTLQSAPANSSGQSHTATLSEGGASVGLGEFFFAVYAYKKRCMPRGCEGEGMRPGGEDFLHA